MRLTSLTSADLLVSVRMPIGWHVETYDDLSFRITGDGAPPPTLHLESGTPAGSGADWFEGFADAVPAELAASVPGIEVEAAQRFELSSMAARVLLLRGRWAAPEEPGEVTAWIRAWIWASSARMLTVAASTAVQRADPELDVLEEIVRSIRLLPPR